MYKPILKTIFATYHAEIRAQINLMAKKFWLHLVQNNFPQFYFILFIRNVRIHQKKKKTSDKNNSKHSKYQPTARLIKYFIGYLVSRSAPCTWPRLWRLPPSKSDLISGTIFPHGPSSYSIVLHASTTFK